MKWITTDYKGNPKVWYSEDEIIKYKSFLQEIRDLKKANIKNDKQVFRGRINEQITGIFPAKCKHCVRRKYQKSFLKKYWCSLNNKLCGYVEVYDCKYEVKDNDR